MSDLGKAYVQIMPSAKGISGSIQKVLQPEATSAGKNAGINIATNISKSLGSLGSTLTKKITLPVTGAVAAASSFILKGGWDRIVGLDSARAQLEGLGYDFEAVERISTLVNETIQGTTTTMAQGVSVAAGALAAGVKEGAELERYIRLVGDAAIGANRETDEMAQIFNRVQGSGKLMTQELNMIEQGMPGFAQAMADSLGIPQDEFRALVTAGEVSSSQFLDVMEDFAGGMSEAYSKSWAGIFSRVKSNLSILGEYMLDGLFPDAKEALADFLETIREDDIRSWARNIGETIGDSFRNLITTIKDVINWWNDLSEGAKSAIKTVVTIAIVIGPIISVLSKVALVITKVIGIVTAVSGALAGGATAFGALKAAALAIMGPVGWITALLAGLVAGGIALYMNWDTVKEKAQQLGQKISDVWNNIKDWTSNTWNNIKDTISNTWESIRSGIIDKMLSIEESIFGVMDSILPKIGDAWSKIYQIFFEGVSSIFSSSNKYLGKMLDAVDEIMMEIWMVIEAVWTFIKESVSNAVGFIMALVNGDFAVMKDFLIQQMDTIKNFFSNTWEGIKGIFRGTIDFIVAFVKGSFEQIKINIVKAWDDINEAFWNAIELMVKFVQESFEKIKVFISNTIESVVTFFGELPYRIGFFLGSVLGLIIQWGIDAWEQAVEIGSNFLENISKWFSELPGRIETFLTETWQSISDWGTNTWNKAEETGSNFLTSISEWFKELPNRIGVFLSEAWENISTWAINIWNKAYEAGSEFVNRIISWFKELPGRIGNFLSATWNIVSTWASNMWTKASEVGSRFLNTIINWFKELPGRIQTWLSETINRVTTWGSDLMSRGKQAGSDLLSSVINEAKKIPGQIFDVGKDVVTGFWNGITSMGSWIKNKVGDFFGGIIDGVKSKLKIFSPSRVFRDEIGVMIARGFGDGIEKGEKYAINPLEQMMDDAMSRVTKFPVGTLESQIALNAASVSNLSSSTSNPGDRRLYEVLEQLLNKSNDVYIDGQLASSALAPILSKEIDKNNNTTARRRGVIRT